MRFAQLSKWRVLVLAIVASVCALTLPATADPADRLEEIREERAANEDKQARKSAQAEEASDEVARLDELRSAAQERVDTLDAQLAQMDARIAEVEQELAEAQRHLTLITEELQGILRRLVRRTDMFTARAVSMYKAGSTAYIDSLLTAETFAEVIERYTYNQAALDADSDLVAEIEILRAQTEQRRDAAEAKRAQIARARLALEADRTELARMRAKRNAVLEERRDAVEAKREFLEEIRDDQQRLEEIESELAADEARLQGLLSGGVSGPLPTGGGQLLWPAAGPVTSGFGPRVHPIFGDVRVHTGIDISVPYGAPVIAADDGVVVFAGVMGGYGNAVVVDHGGGLATTYNHLSAFSLSGGQSIGRGGIVGSVGCTGYCTGPHLHFEVRVNGTPVDPMPYLQ